MRKKTVIAPTMHSAAKSEPYAASDHMPSASSASSSSNISLLNCVSPAVPHPSTANVSATTSQKAARRRRDSAAAPLSADDAISAVASSSAVAGAGAPSARKLGLSGIQ